MTRVRFSAIPRYGLLIGAFLLVVRAAAQQPDNRQSHVPVPLPPGVDLQKLLADRLLQSDRTNGNGIGDLSKVQSDLSRMLQQLRTGGPGAQAETQQQLQQLLQNNPELYERLTEIARNNPQLLNSLMDGVVQQNPELRGKVNPEALRERLQQFAPPKDAERRGTVPRRAERPPNRPAPDRPVRPPTSKSGVDDPALEQNRENISRTLSKLAERFDRERLAPALRDSPAVNHLLERLAQTGAEAMKSGSLGEGLDAQLARWQQRFEGLRDWVPDRLPEKLLDYVPATVSDFRPPNIRMPRFDFRAPGLPSGGLRASRGMGDAAQFILILLLLAAVGVVVWRMLGARAAQSLAGRRGLGPWPLDPERVASRGDLIKAFEYLSLLRCGEKARSWHHRAIAAGLGGTEAERRAAAERLAELYEHARYAPEAEPLPDRAYTDARRHLTYLAGAGRA
jgi:hypothetical protein